MSATWPSSFAGVAFGLITERDAPLPGIATESMLAVTKVPWGDRTIVEDGGPAPTSFSHPIACSVSDYLALRAKRGQSGSLVVAGDAPRTAVLEKLTDPQRYRDNSGVAAVATWIVG